LDNSECAERFDYCLVVIGTTGLGVVFTDPQIAMVGLGPDKLFLASVAEM
jgi:hypothetical protein